MYGVLQVVVTQSNLGTQQIGPYGPNSKPFFVAIFVDKTCIEYT